MERALRALLKDGKFDNVPPHRARIMSAVRGRNNATTERRLRFALVRAGIRGWQLHAADVAGKPDFFFRDRCLAVFVDGCFWHGCEKCGHIPNRNRPFWSAKIDRNRLRDRTTDERLRAAGIRVLRVWEHELNDDLLRSVERVRSALQ